MNDLTLSSAFHPSKRTEDYRSEMSSNDDGAVSNGEEVTNNETSKNDPKSLDAEEKASDEKKTAGIQFLTGMKEDLAARIPLYFDDWKCPRNPMKGMFRTNVYF